MSEYIEREALREELRHCCIVAFDEKSGEPYVIDIPQLLRRTTVSADVAPVVHGEWVLVGTNEHDYETSVEEKCSLCGRYVYRYDTEPQDNYCPNCGAKMDKEVQDERND